MRNYKAILTCLALLTTSYLFAQQEGGEIRDVEIEIVKDKTITLPRANRNFEKVPPRPAEPLTPAMSYDFKTLRFNAPDFNPGVKPLKLKDVEMEKIYGNYISAGFGNYNSPFLRGSLSSKRNAEKVYGVDFFHHSFGKGPVDGKNSGNGYSSLNGYVTGMGPKVTATVGASYENMFNHFCGYKPSNVEVKEEKIRQTYNIVGVNGGITNTKSGDFNYSLNGNFSYLYDRFKAAESQVGLHFNSKYKMGEGKSLTVNSEYFLIARKDSLVEAKPRHLFKLSPSYQFVILEKLSLSAGVKTAYENDDVGPQKSFHLYPDVWIHYPAAKYVDAYAGITGDMDRVSLHTLARENQWINSNINIFHTNRSFEFTGGVKGKIARKVAFNVGTSVTRFKYLYYYYNLATDRSKFNVTYDDAVRLNFFGEAGLVSSDKVQVNLRGDYYSYTMSNLEFPWNRPTYRFGFYSSYDLFDKMLLTVNFVSQGGAKAYDVETNKAVTLKASLNLDAKLRYFVSKQFSAYLEGNNILNSKYPIYQYYQSRGAQVSAGVSWSF